MQWHNAQLHLWDFQSNVFLFQSLTPFTILCFILADCSRIALSKYHWSHWCHWLLYLVLLLSYPQCKNLSQDHLTLMLFEFKTFFAKYESGGSLSKQIKISFYFFMYYSHDQLWSRSVTVLNQGFSILISMTDSFWFNIKICQVLNWLSYLHHYSGFQMIFKNVLYKHSGLACEALVKIYIIDFIQ